MKTYSKLILILLSAGLAGFAVNNAFAQRPFHIHSDERMEAPERTGAGMIGHITDILAETDAPLTAEQISALEGIEPGRGARRAAMDILTEEQRTVLAETWRARRQDKGEDGPEGFRPGGMNREARLEHLERILADAGQPLSGAQKEQLAVLEPDGRPRDRMHDILTDEQIDILHASRPEPPRRHNGRGAHMRGGQHHMIGVLLEETDCPLTEAQKEQLAAIDPGDIVRKKVDAILTEEQKEVFEEARANVPREGRDPQGRRRNPEMLFEVLKDAGEPLSEAQKTAINELDRGPGHRAKLMEILTDEQKKALKAAAKEHRGRGRHRDKSGNARSQHHKFSNNIETREGKQPAMFHRNHPKSTTQSATIKFETPETAHVTLDIYTIEGQRVRTLVDHHVSAGAHSAVWNGTNEWGQHVSAGQYLYKLRTDDTIEIQKVISIN